MKRQKSSNFVSEQNKVSQNGIAKALASTLILNIVLYSLLVSSSNAYNTPWAGRFFMKRHNKLCSLPTILLYNVKSLRRKTDALKA